jgi:hypothetical protein
MVKGEDGRVKYKQRREGDAAQDKVNLKVCSPVMTRGGEAGLGPSALLRQLL